MWRTKCAELLPLTSQRAFVWGWCCGLLAYVIGSAIRVLGGQIPAEWIQYFGPLLIGPSVAAAVWATLRPRLSPLLRLVILTSALGVTFQASSAFDEHARALFAVWPCIQVGAFSLAVCLLSDGLIRSLHPERRAVVGLVAAGALVALLASNARFVLDPHGMERLLSFLSLEALLRELKSEKIEHVWCLAPLLAIGLLPVAATSFPQESLQNARPSRVLMGWIVAALGLPLIAVPLLKSTEHVWDEATDGPMYVNRAARSEPKARLVRDLIAVLARGDVAAAKDLCVDPARRELEPTDTAAQVDMSEFRQAARDGDQDRATYDAFETCRPPHPEGDVQIHMARVSSPFSFRATLVFNPPGQRRGWYLSRIIVEREPSHFFPCGSR